MIDGFDPFRMLSDIRRDLFQNRVHLNALVHEFQIGKADLGIVGSHADSLIKLSDTIGPKCPACWVNFSPICFLFAEPILLWMSDGYFSAGTPESTRDVGPLTIS